MTDWVHSYDINRHLISTSFSNSDGDSNVQGLTSLDFTMTHNYNEPDIATTTAMFVSLLIQKSVKHISTLFLASKKAVSIPQAIICC
jgi:hypothetical protein